MTKDTATPPVDTFWVNGRGWRTKSTDTQPITQTFSATYDRVGQKVGRKLTEATQTGNTLTHAYAVSGAQLGLGYPDGAAATYVHDVSGNMTDVSVTSGGVTVPYPTYSYDTDGRVTNELVSAAGGATRATTYDAAGRKATFTETMQRPDTTWQTLRALTIDEARRGNLGGSYKPLARGMTFVIRHVPVESTCTDVKTFSIFGIFPSTQKQNLGRCDAIQSHS